VAQIEEIATVLICDGDERTLELLSDHLTSDYFEVLPASTGADALRFCRCNSPDIPDKSAPAYPVRSAWTVSGDSRFESWLPRLANEGRDPNFGTKR
jgi:hypothetical protein